MRDRVCSIEGAVHEHSWQTCMLSRVVSLQNRSCSSPTVDFARSIADYDPHDAALEQFLSRQPKTVRLQKGVKVNVFVSHGRTRETTIVDVSLDSYSAQFGTQGVEGTTYLSRQVPNVYCYFSGSNTLSQVPLHCCFVRSSFSGRITPPLLLPRWRAAAQERVMSECAGLRRGSAVKTVDGLVRHVLLNDTDCHLLVDFDMISFGYSKVSEVGTTRHRPHSSARFARALCTDSGCIGLAHGSVLNDEEEDEVICTYSSLDYQAASSTTAAAAPLLSESDSETNGGDNEEEWQPGDGAENDTLDSSLFEDDGDADVPHNDDISEVMRGNDTDGAAGSSETTDSNTKADTSAAASAVTNDTTTRAASRVSSGGAGGDGERSGDRPVSPITADDLCDPYRHRCCAVMNVSARRLAEPEFQWTTPCNPRHKCCYVTAVYRAARARRATAVAQGANVAAATTAGGEGGTTIDGTGEGGTTIDGTGEDEATTAAGDAGGRSAGTAHTAEGGPRNHVYIQTEPQSWRVQLTDDIVHSVGTTIASQMELIEGNLRRHMDERFDGLMNTVRHQQQHVGGDIVHSTAEQQRGGPPTTDYHHQDVPQQQEERSVRSGTEEEDDSVDGAEGGDTATGDTATSDTATGDTLAGGGVALQMSARQKRRRMDDEVAEQPSSSGSRAKVRRVTDSTPAVVVTRAPPQEEVDVETVEFEVTQLQQVKAYGVAGKAPPLTANSLKWMQHSRKYCMKILTELLGSPLSAASLRGTANTAPCDSLDEFISRQPAPLSAAVCAYREAYDLGDSGGGPPHSVVEGIRLMVSGMALKLGQTPSEGPKP